MKVYTCFYCWDRLILLEEVLEMQEGFYCPNCGQWNELEEEE